MRHHLNSIKHWILSHVEPFLPEGQKHIIRQPMKRKTLYALLLLVTCIIAGISYVAYQFYAPPCMRKPYLMKHQEDTLRIAYIGDSWAFMHKDHDCKMSKLIMDSLHRPVRVHSYGICGLTSKEIYENMYENADFKHFLQKRAYEYCFISAGINDTYKKMGTLYYKQSMDGIIQLLLYNNIRPIILEIPDYDIQKAYNWQKSLRKILRDTSMYINGTPVDCKQMFRDALDELFIEKGYQDQVSIIRYKTWNNNYHDDLKRLYVHDGMHLNDIGYAKLDSVIALEIINTINRTHGNK